MLRLPTALFVFLMLLLTACGSSTAPEVTPEPLTTPLEENNFSALTPHEEVIRFVERLGRESSQVTVRQLGTSVEGREIPYLEISNGNFGEDDRKLRVLVFAQQHGNEPSGKEAALLLARDFAAGLHDALLEEIDLLLVPQVNPDGGERHERRNAENVDLNRSHFILDAPETIALRELFHTWQPEVTLDVHEYQPWVNSWMQHGFIRLFDEQYGTPTNLNTPASIRETAEVEFLPYAERYLDERGFTFHNYLVGSPDYVRYSTSNINDGRQSFAMLGTFSFILEGKRPRGDEQATNIERRAAAQQAAIEALLHFSAENKTDLKAMITEEREALREGRYEEFVLLMDRAPGDGPLTIPVLGLENNNGRAVAGDTLTAEIEAYYPDVLPKETISLPDGYLIPGRERVLIDLLEQHRVEIHPLEEGQELNVERYALNGFDDQELANATYRIPEVTRQNDTYTAREGDVFLPTAQLAGRVIATALEPQSKHSILHYDEFVDLGRGASYPILRVLD